MKNNPLINIEALGRSIWLYYIFVIIFGLCLTTCANNNLTPIPEAEYSTKIVGYWQVTVGDSKETMSINDDGTFVCKVQSTGFLANTLSQSLTGTIRGTWIITGSIIKLRITGAKNERLENRFTSSTIVTFMNNELVLKSDNSKTSPFQRVGSL